MGERRCFELTVCRGDVCAGERGADAIADAIRDRLRERAADPTAAEVHLARLNCFGRCSLGPNLHVRERLPSSPGGPRRRRPLSALYSGVEIDDIDEILRVHVDGGRVVARLVRRLSATAAGSTMSPLAGRAASPAGAGLDRARDGVADPGQGGPESGDAGRDPG
ncbi:(2Fe-2S) ferredoxin domain-containing protein [Haliangium sp.]|uniref:(2Fe-2S) ferredoxin domain-containing protein n=1 Tax=Haliangium sp. TaxID=2663208 RepID=UPI003D102AD5